METDFGKFFNWLLNGVSSVRQLRKKVNRVMRKTVNPEFRLEMLKINTDYGYAEALLGLDKPDYAAD